uniref:E3 ubiquitin-protein ligase ARIH1-like UBA-like domain-containing protein n=1 Tax=Ananas comosus var. bracteatus TaxID=296719 RepID=A0A6V7QMR0_ANACO|nr:unnamed protein product [Ananas comosus var. bracteatus]
MIMGKLILTQWDFVFDHNYTILSEADTRQRQEEDISRVSTVLSISRSAACVLLHHYNWSVSKVHDEWFADEEKARKAVGLLEQPADMPNGREIMRFTLHPNFGSLVYAGIGGGIRGNDDKNDSSLNNVDFGGSLTYSGFYINFESGILSGYDRGLRILRERGRAGERAPARGRERRGRACRRGRARARAAERAGAGAGEGILKGYGSLLRVFRKRGRVPARGRVWHERAEAAGRGRSRGRAGVGEPAWARAGGLAGARAPARGASRCSPRSARMGRAAGFGVDAGRLANVGTLQSILQQSDPHRRESHQFLFVQHQPSVAHYGDLATTTTTTNTTTTWRRMRASISALWWQRSYPTLKILRDGGKHIQDYKGSRNADGFVEYLKKQADPASAEIKS